MKNKIIKVWIEEGCIPECGCAATCPMVFRYPTSEEYRNGDHSSLVLGSCRVDGIDSRNELERSPLIGDLGVKFYDKIIDAAYGCPVEVIKYEVGITPNSGVRRKHTNYLRIIWVNSAAIGTFLGAMLISFVVVGLISSYTHSGILGICGAYGSGTAIVIMWSVLLSGTLAGIWLAMRARRRVGEFFRKKTGKH